MELLVNVLCYEILMKILLLSNWGYNTTRFKLKCEMGSLEPVCDWAFLGFYNKIVALHGSLTVCIALFEFSVDVVMYTAVYAKFYCS